MARATAPLGKPGMSRTAPADSPHDKGLGAYYTPRDVARFLAAWSLSGNIKARVLDPACGDGRFLAGLANGLGIDVDGRAVNRIRDETGVAEVLHEDFFQWALATGERFDAAIGNPPFIRYQRFSGGVRDRARELCRRSGVEINGLSSSWAPFVVGASSLLIAGGKVAFIVPAEIGYAVYARPVLKWLLDSFARVELVAIRRKLFPELSEDVWILRAEGYRHRAAGLHFARLDRFVPDESEWRFEFVERRYLEAEGYRLRPLLLPPALRCVYESLSADPRLVRLGDVARLGIGYVTGANDFFHLRPSQVRELGIPHDCLKLAVRSNRDLAGLMDVDQETLDQWVSEDRPIYLLALGESAVLSKSVRQYLESPEAEGARASYKCRNRDPWYVVPDLTAPDAFLSIMSTGMPRLVANTGRAVCTNSVHAVRFNEGNAAFRYIYGWNSELTRLSCEVEGHALGGGLLKLEPAEARRVLIAPELKIDRDVESSLNAALRYLQMWRHGQ